MSEEINYVTKSKETFFKVRILDQYLTGHKGYIAGGVFKNIFTKSKFRDIDIFFKNIEDYNEAVSFYVKEAEWLELYENANAKCFKNKETKVRVELVKSRFDEVENMLKAFDFTIVKFAYFKDVQNDETEYKCMYHPYFFEDLVNKKLVIDESSSFPVSTLERTWKYSKYGFGLCKESKVKIVEMLQGQDSDNVSKNLYFGFD